LVEVIMLLSSDIPEKQKTEYYLERRQICLAENQILDIKKPFILF
jgi:hypothetical protein